MKITVHYESENSEQDLDLKITLPKKWIDGPFSKLINYYIDFHKKKFPDGSELGDATEHHVVFNGDTLAPDVLISETAIEKGSDVYVKRGVSPISAEKYRQLKQEKIDEANRIAEEERKAQEAAKAYEKTLVQCKRFGCGVKFDPNNNNDPTACVFHLKPPIFHETAKWWSCCPTKKALDWEKFQSIKGCQVGYHSAEKPGTQFLGGSDVRGDNKDDGPKLQSIDDFNTAKEKSNALDILGLAMHGVGVSTDIFDRAKQAVLAECGNDEEKAAKVFERKLSVALEMMTD